MKWERILKNSTLSSQSEKPTSGRYGSRSKARLYGVSDANSYESAIHIALCFGIFLTLCILSMFWNGSAEASEGTASWYSKEAYRFNPDPKCPTASGRSLYALEAKKEIFAASYDYPLGSRLEVTNLENKKSVVITIQDRGPARRLNRVIDLGKDAFQEIADTRKGLIFVQVRAL